MPGSTIPRRPRPCWRSSRCKADPPQETHWPAAGRPGSGPVSSPRIAASVVFLRAHDHPADLQVNLAHDLLDRGQEHLAGRAAHDVDIVRAGLDDLGQATERFALRIDHVEPDQLVVVILALRERWQGLAL